MLRIRFRDNPLEEGFDLRAFGRTLPKVSMEIGRVSLMKSERINGKLTYTEIAFVGLNKERHLKS